MVVLAGTVGPSIPVSGSPGEQSSLHLGQRLPASSSRCSSGRTQTRSALIGRLHVRDDAAWLADLLMDLEDEVGEMAWLRLADALRAHFG